MAGRGELVWVATYVLVGLTAHAAPPLSESGPGPRPPLLTFIFDDGNVSDFSVAWPIFQAEGVVACTAVVVDRLDTPGFLRTDQVLELQNAGWEVLSHTLSHRRLNELSSQELEDELGGSRAELELLGLKVHNLVYPMNMNNERVRQVAAKYYRSARGGLRQFNDEVTDRYWLKSFRNSSRFEKAKPLVDQAYAQGRWLILYMHNIDVRLSMANTQGEFELGEELEFSPSGARGRVPNTAWLWGVLGHHLVPTWGLPREGDRLVGTHSGATAEIRGVKAPFTDELRRLLRYVRTTYPDLKVVTVDQALDLLEVPTPRAESHLATIEPGAPPSSPGSP